jgi:hypothetical protein
MTSEYAAILTLLRVTGTIAIVQPLMNFFNKDPTKNGHLVTKYKKTWYFSESKTIDVHCRAWCKHVLPSSRTCYFA